MVYVRVYSYYVFIIMFVGEALQNLLEMYLANCHLFDLGELYLLKEREKGRVKRKREGERLACLPGMMRESRRWPWGHVDVAPVWSAGNQYWQLPTPPATNGF